MRRATEARCDVADNTEIIAAVIADATASEWLKTSLRTALERDMVDAANDAEILAELLRARANGAVKGAE